MELTSFGSVVAYSEPAKKKAMWLFIYDRKTLGVNTEQEYLIILKRGSKLKSGILNRVATHSLWSFTF